MDNKLSLTNDSLSTLLPLSHKSLSDLQSIIHYRKIKKDEVFIKTGKKNTSEYIIAIGFCRSFLFSPEGDEITLSFYKAKDVIPPHLIRTKDDVSLFNFQALTDVEVIEFNASVFLSLMIENLEIREYGNSILKNELIKKTEREIALASLTAKERLMKFREEYAILENLIPHPMIASYLGITNVSLSRLRGSR